MDKGTEQQIITSLAEIAKQLGNLVSAVSGISPSPQSQKQVLASQDQKTPQQGESMGMKKGIREDEGPGFGGGVLSSGLIGTAMSAVTATYASSRERQESILEPAQKAFSELKNFSEKGIVLNDTQLQKIADATLERQEAAYKNITGLNPLVNQGLGGEWSAMVGESLAPYEQRAFAKNRKMVSAMSDFSPVGGAENIDFVKATAQSTFGVDAFGR